MKSRYDDLSRSGCIQDFEKSDIEGMMAYAAPYSSDQLKALNMENSPNSTMGELPKRIGQKTAQWTDFAAGNSGLWRVSFANAPSELKDQLEDQASECLNLTWSQQPASTVLMIKAFKENAKTGFGPVIWEDCHNPMPCAKMGWEPRFPMRTELGFGNLPEFGLPGHLSLQELYEASKRDKLMRDNGIKDEFLGGWNATAIVNVMKQQAVASGSDFAHTSIEDMVLAESTGLSLWGRTLKSSSEIPVIHFWCEEYSEDEETGGRISYYVLANINKWTIIRSKPHYYPDWTNTITAAVDDTGLDGTISGLRGLGLDIRAKCRDMDIVYNKRNWAADHRLTPHYNSTTNSGAEIAERMVIRPNSIFMGQGITEMESSVDVETGQSVLVAMANELDQTQSVYSVNSPRHGGKQRTAAEARTDSLKEQESRLADILPMVQLFIKPLGAEFGRRLMAFPRSDDGDLLKFPGWKVAKYFWDRVKTYPVLAQLLPDLYPAAQIDVNPNATPDGLDKRWMKAEAQMGLLPYLDTKAQRDVIVNDFLIAIRGYKSAEAVMNKTDKPMDTNLAAAIDGESADLLAGSPRTVYPENDHFAHLGELTPQGTGHCAAVTRFLEETAQGIQDTFTVDAAQATSDRLRAGVAFLSHIDTHVMMASQNPSLMDGDMIQAYYDFSAGLKQLLKSTMALFQKELESRAAQDGSQVDPKVAAIMAKTEAEIASMTAKTDAQIKLDEVRMLNKLGNQNQVAEARTQQRQVDYTLQTAMKQQQIKIDMALKTLDAGTRAVQERADAQRDLAKAEKEKAAAAKPAGGAS